MNIRELKAYASVIVFLVVTVQSPQIFGDQSQEMPEQLMEPLDEHDMQEPSTSKPSQQQLVTPENHPAGAETHSFSEERIGSQGNWVKKRKWLEQVLPINNEVQGAIGVLEQSGKSLNEKFSSIQQELGLFYRNMGFEQGKVSHILEEVETYLEKRRKIELEELEQAAREEKEVPSGFYDYKAEEVAEKIHEHKRELEQLELDIKSLEDLDASLSARLKKVDEYVAMVLQDSSQCRLLSDEMWYMIDDQKARENFYHVKNIGEKVKSIINYIQVDLAKDFDEVIERIKTQMDKIKKGITELEAKGYVIENRAQRIEQLRKEKQKKLAEEEAKSSMKHVHARKLKESQVTWYFWPFVSIRNIVIDGISFIIEYIGSFFSSSVKEKTHKKKA